MPTQNGLPNATRTFEVRFFLNGAAANPTTIQGELYRWHKGKKLVVDTLSSGDFISGGTGVYTVTVQPDTYGEFFIRVWNTGDAKTDDAEFSFTVPTPGVG